MQEPTNNFRLVMETSACDQNQNPEEKISLKTIVAGENFQ